MLLHKTRIPQRLLPGPIAVVHGSLGMATHIVCTMEQPASPYCELLIPQAIRCSATDRYNGSHFLAIDECTTYERPTTTHYSFELVEYPSSGWFCWVLRVLGQTPTTQTSFLHDTS